MKHNIVASLLLALPLLGVGGGFLASCSDSYMEEVNTDETKYPSVDPNAQLTSTLLQTFGDFSLMDTYRSYISGFPQYFAGGWNVTNYSGSNYASSNEMAHMWERYYTFSMKNLCDAIYKSEGKQPNTNAALRIHKAFLLSVLTDTYGDVPCKEVGLGLIQDIPSPKYDAQKDIYYWLFDELEACVKQLGTGEDKISGDVTSLSGNPSLWKKYANTLRMRYAMRISGVEPEKAKAEFLKAMQADGGYISSVDEDAYIKYTNAPFTLYDGAKDFDFRANALSEILYGQDPQSPTFICATFYNHLKNTSDPRLNRYCRCYIHTTRSQSDTSGNFDVTDEVNAWELNGGKGIQPNNVGDAWWNDWPTVPSNQEIPTLDRIVKENPEAGYDQTNYPARMVRPSYAVNFQRADNPGILITAAEVNFLLAEAAENGWVSGSASQYYEAGIKAAMDMINKYYINEETKKVSPIEEISADEINEYIANNPLSDDKEEAISQINTQAWILHITNPAEGWSNYRRSGYPALMNRATLPLRVGDFTYEDQDMSMPVRLMYPDFEQDYNKANLQEALNRMGGSDNWHHRMWWDVKEHHVYDLNK